MDIPQFLAHIDTSLASDVQLEEMIQAVNTYKELKGHLILCDADDIDLCIVPIKEVVEMGNDGHNGTYVAYNDNGDLGVVKCYYTGIIILR